MGKLLAKFMLLVCFWNISLSSLPAFSMGFIEDGLRQASTDSKDPCFKGDQASSHSDDADCECDPNNCENENCKFHQCHLGHCNFVIKDVDVVALSSPQLTRFYPTESTLQSVSLAGLIRPPCA